MIQFVVTGVPRSGTMWTAESLARSGLDCTHEFICSRWGPAYDDDGVWRHSMQQGESSPQAGAFVGQMSESGVVVVQVVRHPLLVVSSVLERGIIGGGKPIEAFYRTHCPEPWERWSKWADLPDVVLAFWIDWNMRIRQFADLVWFTPAGKDDVRELANKLGISVRPSLEPNRMNMGNHSSVLTAESFDPQLWDQAVQLWDSL